MTPTERHAFDAQELMTRHEPFMRHQNKQIIFETACPEGCTHGGTLHVTRWKAEKLPDLIDERPASGFIDLRTGIYDYVPVPGLKKALEWHVNFADQHLFAFYSGALFAQDELMAAEHPALGALREGLVALGRLPLTNEGESPTPYLVRGVERRCAVAIEPNAGEGRPKGLYGSRFGQASEAAVRSAVTALDPPAASNIIAMAAPGGGRGPYTLEQLRAIVRTAYTGFLAAKTETAEALGAGAKTVIHTGFWGCGAFGGNRELMALLQFIAANLAGVDRIVFHAVDDKKIAKEAAFRYEEILAERALEGAQEVLYAIEEESYEWGVSDGN